MNRAKNQAKHEWFHLPNVTPPPVDQTTFFHSFFRVSIPFHVSISIFDPVNYLLRNCWSPKLWADDFAMLPEAKALEDPPSPCNMGIFR